MINPMVPVVRLVMNELTDIEINAHYGKALSGFGAAKVLLGYDKIASLYTENDGTEMHAETKRIFTALARQRLGF